MQEADMASERNTLAFRLGLVAIALCAACSSGQTTSPPVDAVDVPDGVEVLGELPDSAPEDLGPCPAGMEVCVFCKQDEDCDGAFPDATTCQAKLCDPELGICILEWLEAGDSCSDGDPCNGDELCADGAGGLECQPGTPLACDDEDACNGIETCSVETGGCVPGQPIVCDDGDACNGVESCVAATGDCAPGEPLVCDDEDPCNGVETCSAETGDCVPGEPLVCDDSDACNGVEECDPATGDCTPGGPLACGDEDPCNGVDSCDPATGCISDPAPDCDDEDPCNGTEVCTPGVGCEAGVELECGDGNPCNGDEVCDPEAGCGPGIPLECSDGDACNGVESCEPELGCILGKAPACDDGDACNGVETCEPDKGCVDGFPLPCDDMNNCTDDGCDPGTGCFNLPNTNPGCCLLDSDCDDDNVCTTDKCKADTKACEYMPAVGPCDDGDPCTVGDTCGAWVCQPGDALPGCHALCKLSGTKGTLVDCPIRLARRSIDDENAVTLSFGVKFEPSEVSLTTFVDRVCADPETCFEIGIPQGSSALAESGHTVFLIPADAAAWGSGDVALDIENTLDPLAPISNAYFEGDLLNGEAHLLSPKFKLLSDIPATAPSWVVLHDVAATDAMGIDLAIAVPAATIVTSDTGCAGTLNLCFDSKPCTQDICNEDTATCSYQVQGGVCNDGNPCTDGDHCDPEGDCIPKTAAAEGTPCTGNDLCSEIGQCDTKGKCIYDPAQAVECPPAPTTCSVYKCNPGTGGCVVSALPSGSSCGDEDSCTENDACDGLGECKGTPLACGDGIDCTLDSCDPSNGSCKNAPDAGKCDDGNPCTADVCSLDAGCKHNPLNVGQCDDKNPCTTQDKCSAGACVGAWDPATCGCGVDQDCASLTAGDLCAGKYLCMAGACVLDPLSPVKCNDIQDDCKSWSCNPQTGKCEAANIAQGTPCNGAPCFALATCNNSGTCTGTPVDCDDGDPCTTDSCDPIAGCVSAPDPGCESKFWLCKFSGKAGDKVTCSLAVVRASKDVNPVVGADFKLTYDTAKLSGIAFEDTVCMGQICMPKKVPSCNAQGLSCVWGSLYPTGHNIVAVPKQLADWAGLGTLLFFHPSDSFKAIAEAYLDEAKKVVGTDSTFLTAKLTLASDVPEAEPAYLWMSESHFSLPTGQNLVVKVQNVPEGRFIVVY